MAILLLVLALMLKLDEPEEGEDDEVRLPLLPDGGLGRDRPLPPLEEDDDEKKTGCGWPLRW